MDASELREEARKQREDIQLVRDLADMMRTDGWKQYVRLLNNKIEERTESIFDPPTDGSLRREDHNKGACYALIWARDLPSVIVESMKPATSSDPAQDEEN